MNIQKNMQAIQIKKLFATVDELRKDNRKLWIELNKMSNNILEITEILKEQK